MSRSTPTPSSSPPRSSRPATPATQRWRPSCSPPSSRTQRPGPGADTDEAPLTVYGDSAYGAGEVLAALDAAGAVSRVKVQPPNAPAGRFSKAEFAIDLATRTVTCPAGVTAGLRGAGRRAHAFFGLACAACPLADRCTSSPAGRTIEVGPHEGHLARSRAATRDPAWRDDYRATRPKVERKIAHMMRRRHGGRRARVRGRPKVGADFSLLAAAVNLARLAVLGLARRAGTWVAGPALA